MGNSCKEFIVGLSFQFVSLKKNRLINILNNNVKLVIACYGFTPADGMLRENLEMTMIVDNQVQLGDCENVPSTFMALFQVIRLFPKLRNVTKIEKSISHDLHVSRAYVLQLCSLLAKSAGYFLESPTFNISKCKDCYIKKTSSRV